MFYRQFRYQPSVVSGPGINSLLMVIYRQGTVLMRRRCEAAWQEKVVQPGDISVLGAGMPSRLGMGPADRGFPRLSFLRSSCRNLRSRLRSGLSAARGAGCARYPRSQIRGARGHADRRALHAVGGRRAAGQIAGADLLFNLPDTGLSLKSCGASRREAQVGTDTRPEVPRAGVHRGSSRARF